MGCCLDDYDLKLARVLLNKQDIFRTIDRLVVPWVLLNTQIILNWKWHMENFVYVGCVNVWKSHSLTITTLLLIFVACMSTLMSESIFFPCPSFRTSGIFSRIFVHILKVCLWYFFFFHRDNVMMSRLVRLCHSVSKITILTHLVTSR